MKILPYCESFIIMVGIQQMIEYSNNKSYNDSNIDEGMMNGR